MVRRIGVIFLSMSLILGAVAAHCPLYKLYKTVAFPMKVGVNSLIYLFPKSTKTINGGQGLTSHTFATW